MFSLIRHSNRKVADLRLFSSWKVAIVGSGPSGCYTAKYLNSALKDTKIDILERLPTAYGLVRNGVAPDHPEVKNVKNDFDKLIDDNDNIQFYGNVSVGKDVSLLELRQLYDIVVLAYGCESDRSLALVGADLEGILSAREFVAWYNGHPDFDWVGSVVQQALKKQPSNDIVVIGHGNVALDCGRILAKTRSELDPTDIATRALDVLVDQPRRISIVGRRGHVQGAFTIKEVRELTKLPQADFVVRSDELEMGKSTEASQQELKDSRPRTRIDKLLTDTASKSSSVHPAQVHLRFLTNPIRFESDNGSSLSRVICERTELVGQAGEQQAQGTGKEEAIDAQLALVSIGYKGVAIEGTGPWFDDSRGVLTNTHGLVDDAKDSLGGLFVSGWLKRGPSGIIGTNIADAKDTVANIVLKTDSQSPKPRAASIPDILRERGVDTVDWEAYQKIDSTEMNDERKRHIDQPREKIVSRKELVKVAFS